MKEAFIVKKHFVEFYSPGSFFAETDMREIDSWDIDKAKELAKEIIQRYGAKPYAFKFITRGRTDDELDSKVIEESGYYFINGIVKTLEEIKAENNPNNKILISNMECNKWDKVVITYSPYKWTQPFRKNDSVVTIE